jgi:murein peptide amidase A
MKAHPPSKHTVTPLDADVLQNQKTPIQSLLKPLLELSQNSDYLIAGSAGEFFADGGTFQIPRFIFMGPKGGGEAQHLGIFAALHGDQPEGSHALVEFLRELELKPQIARGYYIYVYPICNPTGFAAQTRRNFAGEDLTKHFWKGSSQPEIYYLEREIGVLQFQGVISIQTQNNVESFVMNINTSAILSDTLAKPAVQAAQRFLPGNVPKTNADSIEPRHSFPTSDFLSASRELEPAPFELHFGIPVRVPQPSQIHGTVSALTSILENYRGLLSIGQNI